MFNEDVTHSDPKDVSLRKRWTFGSRHVCWCFSRIICVRDVKHELADVADVHIV